VGVSACGCLGLWVGWGWDVWIGCWLTCLCCPARWDGMWLEVVGPANLSIGFVPRKSSVPRPKDMGFDVTMGVANLGALCSTSPTCDATQHFALACTGLIDAGMVVGPVLCDLCAAASVKALKARGVETFEESSETKGPVEVHGFRDPDGFHLYLLAMAATPDEKEEEGKTEAKAKEEGTSDSSNDHTTPWGEPDVGLTWCVLFRWMCGLECVQHVGAECRV